MTEISGRGLRAGAGWAWIRRWWRGPGFARFGQRVGQGIAAGFRCAKCGEVAGVVRVARAGTTVDMGPPIGLQTFDDDALVVDYFLGTSTSFADAVKMDTVQEIVVSDTPDPVALRQVDVDLAPFYCPDCGVNYCSADWAKYPTFDDGFYDYTMGICPNGHRHMIDD